MTRSLRNIAMVVLAASASCTSITPHSFQIIEEDGGVPAAVTSGGPRYSGELFTYEKVMVFDTEQSEDTLLFRPSQFIAYDTGNMYIYDQGIGSILAFNPEGRFTHLIQFQHQQGALRSIVEKVVPRYLDCGNPMNGFARIRWAQLIKQVWLEDPLLCPHCGQEMRIISFITDPPVVDKILRHIQWHPGEPLIPYSRPPPEMLKVAESSLNS